MAYFTFQWHITDACDQRCEHCYIFAEDNDVCLSSMSWEQIHTTLDAMQEFSERAGRKPYIYLTGGDPILHPRFWDLLEVLSERGIPFSIMGNPFHLTDEVCARMKAAGCDKYQLSLDGLRETHDAIRKPGSFDATLDAIAVINRAGIKSVIMTTVSATNIAEIPALVDVVVEHEAGLFAFGRYCPTSAERDLTVDPLDYRALLDACWKKYKAYEAAGVKTKFSLKDHLWTLYRHEEGLFTIPADAKDGMIYDGCHCGSEHMTILPTGDVYACRRMESKVGNVFENSLLDIFLGSAMDTYRDFEKFEKCSKCELLGWCRGCPAVAYGHAGSHFAPDPQCWKMVS